ncbi:MAG: fasciclin domain-containing protein [Candidatus Krumholzibacteriia bacterium]
MKIQRMTAMFALCLLAVTFQVAQAQEHPSKPKQTTATAPVQAAKNAMTAPDIVAAAAAAGDFNTLVAAIKAAGLVETLQGKGPFTVFAPTDAAFAKLPAGTIEDLLKPANKAKLAGILACHVVPGKIMAADVKTMKATNISGQDLDIVVKDGQVTVDGAMVVKADVTAANGVIHAIDTVIMPSEKAAAPASEKPKDHPAH